jgi:predicted RNA-binding protein YlqC (UPF0109 family)
VKPLVEYLSRALVDDPTPVEVFEEGTPDDTVYRVKVGPNDLGKVIGKKGRTAKALRTLLSAVAAKQDRKVSLEIVEPARPGRGPRDGGDDGAADARTDDANEG